MFKLLKKNTKIKFFIDFKSFISNKNHSFKQHCMQPEQNSDILPGCSENNEPGKKKMLVNNNKMKLNKKLAQGIKVLCQNEKKEFTDLCKETVSKDLFVIHFGNGDEDDFNGLEAFLGPYGSHKLHIFPGISYGFLEFEDVQSSEELKKNMTKVDIVSNSIEIPFSNRTRNVFFFNSKIAFNDLNRSVTFNFPNSDDHYSSIPGLILIENFITKEAAEQIFQNVDTHQWTKLSNRRVQHYGYEFLYGINTVNPEKKAPNPIPEFLSKVTEEINLLMPPTQGKMDQLTINDYMPGDGIPPHFDTHSPFEEFFVALSLGSGITMSFKSVANVEKHIYIPDRALIIFSGEARYAWYHTISQRKVDKVGGKLIFRRRRISLTFRKIKNTPCQCKYPFFCDSQGYDPVKEKLKKEKKRIDQAPKSEEESKMLEMVQTLEEDRPTDLEKKFVYEIYEKIAPHFSHTRYKPWPKIEEFLLQMPLGTLLADVGCGNGKYIGINDGIIIIGTDRSENLLTLAKEKDNRNQVFSADSLKLPFRDAALDGAISIAVIHHFSNKSLRKQAIRELQRIIKKDGIILIYVWAFEQEERNFTEQDIFVPWNLQYKFEDENTLNEIAEKIPQKDVMVDETKKTVVYKRYYHVFKKGELEDLVMEIEGLQIIESYYDHANWCVKLRKTH